MGFDQLVDTAQQAEFMQGAWSTVLGRLQSGVVAATTQAARESPFYDATANATGVTVTDVNQSTYAVGLQDVVDEARIRALHADYVDAVNRQAWAEFEDFFVPDAELTVVRGDAAPDVVTGPKAIGALIAGYVSRYDFLIQVILNARIRVRQEGDPDRAFARLYIAEFRQVTTSGRAIESAGIYHDEYRRVDGQWWFARRRYDRMYATAPSELDVHPFPTDLPVADAFRRRG